MEGAHGAPQETKSPTRARRVWRVVRWPVWIVLMLYIAVVIYRVPAMQDKQKTDAAVTFMFSQTLSPSAALGADLPPVPDAALNNSTLFGVDANHNGIRDDIEVAVFKLHPDSARVRAAELQYALEAQLELSSVFNQDTWVAEAKYEAHGINCLADTAVAVYPKGSTESITKPNAWRLETEALVFNTDARKQKRQQIQAYEVPFVDSSTTSCDVDIASLPN